MRHFLLTLVLSIYLSSSFAQNNNSSPTLQVIGVSRLSIRPDVGVLVIKITNVNMSFSDAITGLNEKTRDISRQIIALGFKEDEIKTTDFEVDVNSFYRKEESIDSGYIATQAVNVDFKNQSDVIAKILTVFSKSSTDFTLSFKFKLSGPLKQKAQEELLRLAVKDSKDKSKLIAESSGVKLKRIKEIRYGTAYYEAMRQVENVYQTAVESAKDVKFSGFTPNDLLFEDGVVVTWEIEL